MRSFNFARIGRNRVYVKVGENKTLPNFSLEFCMQAQLAHIANCPQIILSYSLGRTSYFMHN